MRKKIEYLDSLGKIITQHEASQLNDHEQRHYIDERLKEVVIYWDKQIQSSSVFIYPDENLNQELEKLDSNISYAVAKDMQVINNYTVWLYYSYKNGILSTDFFQTRVFESNNKIIAIEAPNLNLVEKTYYLQGKHVLNEEEELDFVYQEDDDITFVFKNGELKISTFNPWDGNLSPGEFQGTYQDRLPFMTQEIFEYFTKPEPLIPPVEL